jgi:hypothetical protein
VPGSKLSVAKLVQGLVPYPDRYPRPQWEEIANRATGTNSKDENGLWWNIAEHWAGLVEAAAGPEYRSCRSEHFLLASRLDQRSAKNLLGFAERARRKISGALTGIAATDGLGPHVIFIFDSDDEYYEYIAPFYGDRGHYGLSSGVHLNAGYAHLALPRREPDLLEPVIAHELTHSLVSHLRLPRWLDEGIAVNVESALCPRSRRRLRPGWLDRHRNFWNEESVQHYWSGVAFSTPNELSELSYELSWMAVKTLGDKYEAFRSFVLEASFRDAGQSASLKVFGIGLGHQFELFLGPGDWDPMPGRWGSW